MRLGKGHRGVAAHTTDDGGDTLCQHMAAVVYLFNASVQMTVGVDEAGSQHLSGTVDDPLGLSTKIVPDPRDLSAFYGYIGVVHGISRAVGNASVGENNVVHFAQFMP